MCEEGKEPPSNNDCQEKRERERDEEKEENQQ
jgi:hypothetical protein